jgi:hypothetical protein
VDLKGRSEAAVEQIKIKNPNAICNDWLSNAEMNKVIAFGEHNNWEIFGILYPFPDDKKPCKFHLIGQE